MMLVVLVLMQGWWPQQRCCCILAAWPAIACQQADMHAPRPPAQLPVACGRAGVLPQRRSCCLVP
jgi:hypothetical protein